MSEYLQYFLTFVGPLLIAGTAWYWQKRNILSQEKLEFIRFLIAEYKVLSEKAEEYWGNDEVAINKTLPHSISSLIDSLRILTVHFINDDDVKENVSELWHDLTGGDFMESTRKADMTKVNEINRLIKNISTKILMQLSR